VEVSGVDVPIAVGVEEPGLFRTPDLKRDATKVSRLAGISGAELVVKEG
jgi:hypothetical protein